MKEKLKLFVALAAVGAAFALLLLLPAEAAAGAQRGLALCAGVILPSLLPFLILSGLAAALGLPALLARVLAPVLSLLGVAPESAGPLLLGLLGGYPVGAAAVSEQVKRGALTPEEGTYLPPNCNNTGPGVILGVAGAAVFGSVRCGALLYAAHVLAALPLARFSGGGRSARSAAPPPARAVPLAEAFTASVGAAALTAVQICAYVIFFSTLTALLRAIGLFSALAAAFSARFHTELRVSYALLSGLLELSSGVGAMQGMAPTPRALALAAFLLGFGGMSVHAQTLCAVAGTDVKCARHFAGRIVHGLLSALYVCLLFFVMRRRI